MKISETIYELLKVGVGRVGIQDMFYRDGFEMFSQLTPNLKIDQYQNSKVCNWKNHQPFLFSKSLESIIQKVKIKAEYDIELFADIKVKNAIYLIGENEAIITNEPISNYQIIFYIRVTEKQGVYVFDDSCAFVYDTNRKKFTIDIENDNKAVKVFKHLMFLEFSETEYVAINPKKKITDKTTGVSIKNDLRDSIIYVKMDWNKSFFSEEEINVRGHLRLQRVGIGRMQKRYTYVKAHTRDYLREAGNKVLDNND
jgi:hypothetical protein